MANIFQSIKNFFTGKRTGGSGDGKVQMVLDDERSIDSVVARIADSAGAEEYIDGNIPVKPKHEYRQELKEAYRKKNRVKFRRGDLYVIKHYVEKNVPYVKRIYQCRQIVWCIDNVAVCGVVVKQVYGFEYASTFLGKKECETLHIKYEPGLQLLSMYLEWRRYKGDIETLKLKGYDRTIR